jgi:Protein of unknown function (DUF3602)
MTGERPSEFAQDLVTPTLKQDMYTTGRGGSGNMAKLESVDNARKAQDVDAPVHSEPENAFHYGRGGAANIAKLSEEEKRQAHEKNQRKSDEIARQINGGEKGLAEKIKEKVGLGSKK